MNRDKQIEEMARELIDIQHNFDEYCAKPCRECGLGGVVNCESHYKAEKLYVAGYRKSTELAEEIFEEIEKVVNYALCVDITDWSAYNVLKKKYTENCDETNE
jgi:hypothetical protein